MTGSPSSVTTPGMVISYALAADYPDRVDRVALAEVPGPPTPDHSPPLFTPREVNNKLWHIAFNRAGDIAEQLVEGREAIFFGYEFAVQGGPGARCCDRLLRPGLSAAGALTGSFGFYRAWDETMAQNGERGARKLTMPVLGIGGEASWGEPSVGHCRPSPKTSRPSSSLEPVTG